MTDFDIQTGLPVLHKDSGENVVFSFDFGPDLVGITLTGASAIESTKQDLVSGSSNVTLTNKTYDGNYGQVRISGGTDGEDYLIKFTMTTSDSGVLVGKGLLQVRD